MIVGSYEARTRFPELLRAAERGEVVTITRCGQPVAQIVGVERGSAESTRAIIERVKAARGRRPSVTTEEILAARDEGRRS